jgi:hypothetical protein
MGVECDFAFFEGDLDEVRCFTSADFDETESDDAGKEDDDEDD